MTTCRPSPRRPASAASLTLAFGLAAASLSAEPVLLEVEYETGKRYVQENAQDMDVTLNVLGQSLGTSTRMTQRMAIAVSPRDEGGKVITITYDGIKMESSAMGQRMSYDSDNPDDSGSPLAGALGGLMSEETVIEMDEAGEVVAFRAPGGVAEELVNEEQILQMIGAGMAGGLPSEPVSPGHTWTHKQSTELPQMGSMNTEIEFTFEEVTEVDGRQLAKISYTGTVTGGEAPADSPLPMTFSDDGTIKGKMTLDIAGKQVVDSDTDMSFTMNLGGQEVPAKANNRQRLVSVEDL